MSAAAAPVRVLPAATAPAAALRWFPSLRDAAWLMPVFFLFLRLQGTGFLLGDGDTGWHLRTGEWILQNGRVPYTDFFSFTRAGQPWFAWEWLWDVCFGWIHMNFGMGAVLVANLALISAVMYLVYRESARLSGSYFLAFGVTFLTAAGSTIHWLARPHLVTLLFTAVSLMILNRAAEGRVRLLAWLPALTMVWVNLHGGFFVLWTLLAAHLASAALVAFLDHRSPWRAARPWLLALAACVAASFLNPYGWRLHRHIFGYLGQSYHREQIQEFLSISFHHSAAYYFAAMLLLAGMTVLWALERRRFADALILTGWGWLALYAARNIPIFLIAAAPAVALALQDQLGRLACAATRLSAAARAVLEAHREFALMEAPRRVVWLPGLVFAALALLAAPPASSGAFRNQYDPKSYPENALAAIRSLGPETRLFTNDEWGDFLLYRLWPGMRVFIDGRSDFYGEKLGEDMGHLLQARHDWAQILARYQIGAVLLRAGDPLASVLKLSPGWRLLHDDGAALLFQSVSSTARGRAAAETVNVSHPNTTTTR
jgi:hypothetical protein